MISHLKQNYFKCKIEFEDLIQWELFLLRAAFSRQYFIQTYTALPAMLISLSTKLNLSLLEKKIFGAQVITMLNTLLLYYSTSLIYGIHPVSMNIFSSPFLSCWSWFCHRWEKKKKEQQLNSQMFFFSVQIEIISVVY